MFFQNSYAYTLRCLGGKWKPHIIWELHRESTMRYRTFLQRFPITDTVLTQTLRELESDGLVQRTIYAEVPLRVEYNLTSRGTTAIPVLRTIYDWGRSQMLLNGDELDYVSEMRHGYMPEEQSVMEKTMAFCVEHPGKVE